MKIIGSYPKIRLRRVRNYEWSRRLISENNLSVNDLIQPIFIIEGKNKIEEIKSMPGVYRYTIDKLDNIMSKVEKLKIPAIAIFPNTPKNKRDKLGSESFNENNLVCRAVRKIKKKYINIGVMCDVALDPYTSHGHDGVLINKRIDNDKTIDILIKQSLNQAMAGCDVIAPSDMMDGRIGKIRKALYNNGFTNVQIVSYGVKYASNFYGPFRDAVGSKSTLIGNKKTYQMDFKNSNEAMREVGLDIKEGADMIIVKPGMPYLDIIKEIKNNFKIPIISYQVSGEYSLIKNGIKKNLVDKGAIIESLYSVKRAGSNAIITYFAIEIAEKIKKIN